ncbi:TPA: hypothetical protein ACJXT7_000155 [Streptococcus pneumoniae]
MVFTAKSSKINIEEVRALSKLEGQALVSLSQTLAWVGITQKLLSEKFTKR